MIRTTEICLLSSIRTSTIERREPPDTAPVANELAPTWGAWEGRIEGIHRHLTTSTTKTKTHSHSTSSVACTCSCTYGLTVMGRGSRSIFFVCSFVGWRKQLLREGLPGVLSVPWHMLYGRRKGVFQVREDVVWA